MTWRGEKGDEEKNLISGGRDEGCRLINNTFLSQASGRESVSKVLGAEPEIQKNPETA